MESTSTPSMAGEVLMQFRGRYKSEDPPEHNVSNKVKTQQNAQPLENVKTFDDVDVSKLSDKYKMNHKFRGCFIILNHMNFEAHLDVPTRKGTEVDCEQLENTAKMLGFEYVRSFHDLIVAEIVKLVGQIAESDHSQYDCLAIAVLTHGNTDNYLYAKDNTYHLDKLTNPFLAKECNTLAGKPKLFFIQACRGNKLISGYALASGDNEDTVDSGGFNDDSTQKLVIPNSADFLLAFSTLPGFFAWRNEQNGSCFIQALCKCFDEFGDKLELMQIMTRVNRVVAYKFESNCTKDPKYHKKKQMPSIVTRLTHDVYFSKPKPLN